MKNLKNLYISAGVLQALAAILWFVPLFSGVSTIRSNMLGEVLSVGIADFSLWDYFNDLQFIVIASMIGLLLSTVLSVLPVIRGTYKKHHRLFYSKISAIYSVAMFVMSFEARFSASKEYASVGGEANIKLGGVIFIIVNIALLIVLFMISSKSKKQSKQPPLSADDNG